MREVLSGKGSSGVDEEGGSMRTIVVCVCGIEIRASVGFGRMIVGQRSDC